jgi:hypothetical protein
MEFGTTYQTGAKPRSLADLASSESSWRVLNLLAANTPNPEVEGPQPPRLRFFANPVLNRSIMVKHNVRSNELHLFAAPLRVATKVIVPLDQANPNLGARTFYVGERHFESHLVQATGVDVRPGKPLPPDVSKLKLMDTLPSLDAFLVRERLRHDGFDVDVSPDWFDRSLGGEAEEFLRDQFGPLLEMAMGARFDRASADKFFHDVFFDPKSEKSLLMARAMRVEPAQWPDVLFTWKASIFYEWSTRNVHRRFGAFTEALKRTRIYAGSDAVTRAEIENIRRKMAERASNLYRELEIFQARFESHYREQFLAQGDPARFRDYLMGLKADLVRFGCAYASLEHMVSYWKHAVSDRQMSAVPADYFMDVARSLSAAA